MQRKNYDCLKKVVTVCYIMFEALSLGLAIITAMLNIQKVLQKYSKAK